MRPVTRLHRHLARAEPIAALSALAIPTGLAVGVVIVAFRLLTERLPVWLGWLPAVDRYEALPLAWRIGLPIAGGIAIGVTLQALPAAVRATGPTHVMAALARQGGRLPWRNALVQFLGAAAAIVTGHSVGREGPVIHVGAACASQLGQALRLPNNSLRTLVACGVAAAIAASFNTPLAGVVFAMEAILLEYTLASFAPVILAAVVATLLSRTVFGAAVAFAVPELQLVSLLELPWIVLLGVVIGGLAALYVAGIVRLDRLSRPWPVALRTTLAGVLCGACAWVAPEVMGLGYDTVEAALLGQLTLAVLATIVVAKLVATIGCAGLAVPGGMIGPMIVIGATAGGALGIIGHAMVPQWSAPPAFYATLGAAAMMGACLHAPLAALTAVLELTGNPNTLLPGMAAVVTALLVARAGFRQPALFIGLLRQRGLVYRVDPLTIALDRIGVAAVMDAAPPVVDVAGNVESRGAGDGAGVTGADVAGAGVAGAALAPDAWIVLARGEEIVGVARAGQVDRPLPMATVAVHATLGEAFARLEAAEADIAVVLAADAAALAERDEPSPTAAGESRGLAPIPGWRRDQLRGLIAREAILEATGDSRSPVTTDKARPPTPSA